MKLVDIIILMDVYNNVETLTNYTLFPTNRYIKWPKEHQYGTFALGWYEKHGFPQIIGCVDGTHVPIKCPNRNDNIFYCRKDFHSLNVMV